MLNTIAIKRRMKEIGITQAELAKEINVKTPTMNQKINNIRPLTLDEAEKMAKRLLINDSEFGAYFFAQ